MGEVVGWRDQKIEGVIIHKFLEGNDGIGKQDHDDPKDIAPLNYSVCPHPNRCSE